MEDCIRLQRGGAWDGDLKMEHHLGGEALVGPFALGRTIREDTEVRISKSTGAGGVEWGGAERHRKGTI